LSAEHISPHAVPLAVAVAALAERRFTARALAEAQLACVDATDSQIDAWATLDRAHVLAEADRCDVARASGLLAGIGIGVKDIIATRALPTGMGSPIFAEHVSDADAACVTRLVAAGGYVFGKTVTTEFAFMHPGKTRNPWNVAHTPGGSSSGSAAAVAAGHVCGAIGTQTNGSVIRPAAYCGVVGFKPTYGAIPFDGVNVFSETLDTLGTFTRTAADAARLAAALADNGRIPAEIAALDRAPRFAYLASFPWTKIDRDVAATLSEHIARLHSLGAEISAITVPSEWHSANLIHRTIALYEAARNLGALQKRDRQRLSSALNAALDEGHTVDERIYHEAIKARTQAIDAFAHWLAPFDAVITPPAPAAAPRDIASTGDPSCCTLFSLVGFPAITLPIGRNEWGLPLGMQLATTSADDGRLLSVAAWCEERLPFVGLV
jgi:Asp-tRNA(Asn)/Glu-tRNA(Gln) amidotransferase A subunit family amidase